ncbi:hypothetical protein ACFCP7_05360 [Paenibacillus elgii]
MGREAVVLERVSGYDLGASTLFRTLKTLPDQAQTLVVWASGMSEFTFIFINVLGLLFITNVTSMHHPELWDPERGFWRSLFAYPTIWQRCLHFMAASFTMLGLFLYGWGRRIERNGAGPVMEAAKRSGKTMVAGFTLLQLLAGPLLLFSMDSRVRHAFMGGSAFHTALLAVAVLLAIGLCWLLVRLVRQDGRRLFVATVCVLLIVLTLMSWIRHEVREIYLQPYMEESPRTVRK